MKMIKYIWLLLLLLPLGCSERESHYGGIEIDEITVEGIEDYYEIEVGSHLTIPTTITTKFGDASDLSYVWYKYNSEQVVADTLSFEKDLDVVIGDVIPGVETTLVFKVIDNTTGIYTSMVSKFKTIGKYAGGTLILYRNDGACDLAMLQKDGFTFYENIYSIANHNEKLGEKSKRLLQTKEFAYNAEFKSIIVTCDDQTGGVSLNTDALVRKSYVRDNFMITDDFEGDLVVTAVYNGNSYECMIVNGKVYSRQFWGDPLWAPEFVFLKPPYNYYAAEFAARPTGSSWLNGGTPMLYDNVNGRFMGNFSGGYFSEIKEQQNDFSVFDPNNVGKGMELVTTGCVGSKLDDMYFLMKNTNTGEFVLLRCKFSFLNPKTFTSISKTVLEKSKYPGLYAAKSFRAGNKFIVENSGRFRAIFKGLSDVFFYISNDNVYAFNVQSLVEDVIIKGADKNYAIDHLECNEVSGNGGAMLQMTLGIKDHSLSGKQGGIAVYRLSSIGGLTAEWLYSKTGFCDEVIATLEKEN